MEFPQVFPRPGWVEHKPSAIWGSVRKALRASLEKAKVSPSAIAAIGLTNQRETFVSWDAKTGQPLGNAIVWQCRRSTEVCKKLRGGGLESQVRRTTGLVLDPYFSGSKMKWLLKNSSEHRKLQRLGRLRFGTIDSFLIWKLTGGKTFVTDCSNASRTSLMSLKTMKYDADMLKIFDVKRESLPEILPSNSEFGRTKKSSLLPGGIPIFGVLGDQQAALFGQTCFRKGDAKVTFGTGSFLLLNTGNRPVPSKTGLITTVGWQLQGKPQVTYALEGGAFNCGSAVQWLRDGMGFFKNASEIEKLAKSVKSSEGVFFVPAFSGLGAPHWRPEVRGTLIGLSRGTQRAHMARATLDSLALQNIDIFQAMKKDSKIPLKTVRVDGGASQNNLLMQIQANTLGVNVFRPKNGETTSLGAGLMAGLGLGWWQKLDEISKLSKVGRTFRPQMSAAARKRVVGQWQEVVSRLPSLYCS